MASLQTSQEHVLANVKHNYYDFDPDSAAAADVAWVDMQGYQHFYAAFVRTVGTGALDTFTILGNSASDGSGTDVIIKAHAVANEPNAVGDFIVIECTAEEIAQEGSDADENLRYVSISAEFATSTDEGVIHYARSGGRAFNALTSESIA